MNAPAYRTQLSQRIQSRIARQLGLSRSYVCLVVNGKRTSRLVEAALEKEYRRIDRLVRRYQVRTEAAA